MKLISLVATSTPMASCASSVDPPMCGVMMTLGSPQRGMSTPWGLNLWCSGVIARHIFKHAIAKNK